MLTMRKLLIMQVKEFFMNKKYYESPALEIKMFKSYEVIAASGVLNDKGEIELPFVPAME